MLSVCPVSLAGSVLKGHSTDFISEDHFTDDAASCSIIFSVAGENLRIVSWVVFLRSHIQRQYLKNLCVSVKF